MPSTLNQHITASILAIILLFFPFVASASTIRAAIDIGSGGTKLRVAEVDEQSNKIIKILDNRQYTVLYQKDLMESPTNSLSSIIMSQGIAAISEAIGVAQSFGANKVIAIATGVFRKAVNGETFAKNIELETGLSSLHLLDQYLEGVLAFNAAQDKLDIDAEDLVIWDIGGNSTQFIEYNLNGSFYVDCGNDGAGAFEKHIIEVIQHKNMEITKSPNPFSPEEIEMSIAYACSLSNKANQRIKTKLSKSNTKVVGVSSVFGRGLLQFVNEKNPITVEELDLIVKVQSGKTDQDFGGGDFARCELSNAILVLGFMQGLNIHQLYIADVNNADGALIHPAFW